ncbi:hypothetical protein D8666_21045 [Ochrobactrum soli]|nr:hypothetical protein D8666_21045 [[Ochrobactrum] soli]
MRTVSALFSNTLQAKLTIAALVASGIHAEEIAIISSGSEGELTENAAGVAAGTGALVGGTAGLLTGLGLMAIPGLGRIVAAGWLASTLTGAVSGLQSAASPGMFIVLSSKRALVNGCEHILSRDRAGRNVPRSQGIRRTVRGCGADSGKSPQLYRNGYQHASSARLTHFKTV